MAVTHINNLSKFLTAPLLKRLHNGRFTSETAARKFQKRNGYYTWIQKPEVVKMRWGF
jgi:hypothetical protein